MVDVTTLDFYKEKPKKNKDGEKMIPYLNVKLAEEDKIEYKWLRIARAYIGPASVFDKQGDIIEGEKVDKWHVDLEYTPDDEGVEKKLYKWPLNSTNWKTLKSDFGNESDDWVGEFIKIKVHTWQSGTRGLVVISRKELKKLDVKIPERDEDGGEPSPSSSDDPFSLSAGEYVNTLVNRFNEAGSVVTKNVLFQQARDELLKVDPEFLGDVAREIDRRDYA